MPDFGEIVAFTPFVQVADVQRSIGFYRRLGLEVGDTFEPGGTLAWAFMANEEARVMFARCAKRVLPGEQGVLFYLYSRDLAALRERLVADGVEAGPIEDGTPGPKQEMRLVDPDGYVLMVAQIEPAAG